MGKTLKGDAFSRSEVSSRYVHRNDRYIFSFVVGFGKEQVDSAVAAAAAAIEMMRGEGSEQARVFVFDRETGETTDMSRGEVDRLMAACTS